MLVNDYEAKTISFIGKLILVALILTPIFTFQESLSLLIGGFINYSSILTSPYIKGVKDLIFIFIILSSILFIIQTLRVNRITLIILTVILIFILLPAYYFNDNIWLYLSGIRWIMPFILLAFLINHIDKNLILSISKILFYLFLIHFTFQIIQVMYALNPYMRNPGIFIVPNTAALFSLIVLFFCVHYMGSQMKKLIHILVPISIYVTQSGTGIAVYIIFMMIYHLPRRYLIFVPIISILMVAVLLVTLDFLTGRYGLVENSLGPRVTIFLDLLWNGNYWPENFGIGTATAYLLSNKFDLPLNVVETDSWYAGIIVNLGLFTSFLILTIIMTFLLKLLCQKIKRNYYF